MKVSLEERKHLYPGPSGLPLPDLCRQKRRRKVTRKEYGGFSRKMERMNASVHAAAAGGLHPCRECGW